MGLVREHNEDSFLYVPPLFATCDGMGGHVGEVASSIAVNIAEQALSTADDVSVLVLQLRLLTRKVDALQRVLANLHGPTASAVFIEGNQMAGWPMLATLVFTCFITQLWSALLTTTAVEELIDSGRWDEARTHPSSRSVVTRALTWIQTCNADHFSLEVSDGDRIICAPMAFSWVWCPTTRLNPLSLTSRRKNADNLVSAVYVWI